LHSSEEGIFLHVDVLKGQHVEYINHVGEFWCFFIMTLRQENFLTKDVFIVFHCTF